MGRWGSESIVAWGGPSKVGPDSWWAWVLASEVGVAAGVVVWEAVIVAVAIDLGVSFVTASVITTFLTFVQLAACHGC